MPGIKFIAVVAVEELPAANHVIAILLEELRQEDGVVEYGIVDEGALVDVIPRCARADPAHDGRP